MISRDTQEKPARRKIPDEPRLTFQRELAWWAWTRSGENQGHFLRDAIPPGLVAELPAGGASDAESKFNEYLVSTLTEVKQSGYLFFAHRSFQEFLVAERMIVSAPAPTVHAEYSKFCNPEIAEFLLLAPDQSFWERWFESLLLSKGPVKLGYFSLFVDKGFGFGRGNKALWTGEKGGMLTAPCLAVAYWELTRGLPLRDEYFGVILQTVITGEEIAALFACFLALYVSSVPKQDPLSNRLVAAFLERCLRKSTGSSPESRELTITASREDFFSRWIRSHLSRSTNELAGFTAGLVEAIRLELTDRHGYIVDSPSDANVWKDLSESSSKKSRHDREAVYRHLPTYLLKQHYTFLRGDRTKFQSVPVATKVSHNTTRNG